jgi:putative mycofactocin binding protein MftB
MVSAVSTEPTINTRINRQDDSCYTISPHVRVRKEAFGLLFYNTEDSRLTFVKSGDLLQIKTLPHGAKRIMASLEPETYSRVRKLLDHLLKKRLICES